MNSTVLCSTVLCLCRDATDGCGITQPIPRVLAPSPCPLPPPMPVPWLSPSPQPFAVSLPLIAITHPHIPPRCGAFCCGLSVVTCSKRVGRMPPKPPLPPPPQVLAADAQQGVGVPPAALGMGVPQAPPLSPGETSYGMKGQVAKGSTSSGAGADTSNDANDCPVCLQETKSMAFQCGHQVSSNCSLLGTDPNCTAHY